MSDKLYPVTCSCSETIHVAADAREHVAEMRATIVELTRRVEAKNAKIIELQNRVQELELGLTPEEAVAPLGFIDDTWKNPQMRLFR